MVKNARETVCIKCGRSLGTLTSNKRRRTQWICRFCKEGVRVGQSQ